MSAQGTETQDFLRVVPIFAGLSDELQTRVAARATSAQLPAGQYIFQAGDAADALYVLQSGRLEVLTEEGELIRVLSRGAVLGELALLTGTVRSAGVRARRDSTLLRLDREDFDALLRDEPEFAAALTQELGHQLQASRAIAISEDPRPSVVAMVPLGPQVDVEDFAGALEAELSAWGMVARIDEADSGEDRTPTEAFGPLVDSSERTHDQVLLVSGHAGADHPWTAFCLREADRILAAANPATLPSHQPERMRGCDLVLLETGSAPTPAAGWEDVLEPRAVHRVRGDAGMRRVARRLAGRSIGVVLSGGGARGFAHIGVLEELEAAGLAIDRLAGCSMGALIGALFACGLSADEISARCREEFVERNPHNDYTLPLASLIRGRKVEAMLRRLFGDQQIEDLEREFFCVSCDLISSELVVHSRGDLYAAVGSSICLPGIGAPVPLDGRLLVDGGVLNNLPVEQLAGRGEGPVIAVDVSARFEAPEAAGVRFRRPGVRRLAARARSWAAGRDAPVPSLKETLVRTIVLGSIDTAEAAQRHASLIVTPEVSEFGLLEFGRIDAIREAGREATRPVLAEAAALRD